MTEERFGDLCNRTHGCSQNCVNTIGSFVCVCFKGFEKDLTSPDSCSGKWSKLSSDWLVMSSNRLSFGKIYSDYDECGFGLHNCHKDAHCHNIDTTDTVNPVGFRCECKIGFHGDGFICNNIDECYNNQNNCGEGSTCKDITPTDAKPGTLVNFGNTQARF